MRDSSRFFVVYETGDATVMELGLEADPWDLFYSRAAPTSPIRGGNVTLHVR